MRFTVAISLVLLSPLLASIADAGVIRGTLWMNSGAEAAHSKTPDAEPDPHAQRGASDAVIYIEEVPEKVERKLKGGGGWFFFRRPKPHLPRIVQMNRQFNPHVIAIAAGTHVEIQNLDAVYHNAFSVSSAKRFDLGKYPPGKSDTVVFDRSGVINLHCEIHPNMLGYVVVTPNHAYARPDSIGRYHLPNLPAGTYTVHAFHPRHGEIKRSIEVPKHGDLTLDLSF